MDTIGLDVHKCESQLCILAPDGSTTEQRIVTSRERFTTVLGPRAAARILLEASTESEWVARHLESLGHEVIVADPNYAPMYATRTRRVKTDKRDARTLAEKVLLRDLVEDAIRLFAIGDHYDKIFQRDYGEEEPEFYDRHVIVQILVNFLSNAKNAVRERQDNSQPRITVTVRQDDGHTSVAVSDNGVGFDASVKPRLFTHGFTTRAKGHGFGLHSSALSAQALGGRIEAHSEGHGTGCTISFRLPYRGLADAEGAEMVDHGVDSRFQGRGVPAHLTQEQPALDGCQHGEGDRLDVRVGR